MGHRGASLSSADTDGFCGMGAFIGASAGWSCGVLVEDRFLCTAAAEGGLIFVAALPDRDGLTSLLFFRDRVFEVFLATGLTGEESLDGFGELAADEL